MTSRGDTRPELPFDPDAPPRGARPLHRLPGALVWVAIGGVAGTAARYALALAKPPPAGAWPWATFIVNIAGAFILGALLEALARAGTDSGWRRNVRLLAGTGFCGSLTTYSTFAVEADLLVRDHAAGTALGYLAASLIVGLIATAAGIAAATGHHRWRRARPAAAPAATDEP